MPRPGSSPRLRSPRRRRATALLLTAVACHSDGADGLNPGAPAVRDVAYTARALPTLGGATAYAAAMNAQGLVVGSAEDAAGVPHPVVWRAGVATRLADGGSTGGATAVNGRGDVAGVVVGVGVRLWRADGTTQTPAGPLAVDTASARCCTTVNALNNQLQAIMTTRQVAVVDFSVDSVVAVLGSTPETTAGGLNDAGHAVGWTFAYESDNPVYWGVAGPSTFPALPAGAPHLCAGCGHSFAEAYFIDDADRIYGAINGAAYVAPAGGQAVWLYPYTANASPLAVSGGGLLAVGNQTDACPAAGAPSCVATMHTISVFRASDRATFRVAVPAPWAVERVRGISDAGEMVATATDGTRETALLLTPSTPIATARSPR